MLEESRRGRLVVIGHDLERPVGAGPGGVPRQLQRLRRGVGTGPGHNRNPPARGLNDHFRHMPVLVMRQRRRFARRSAGHKPFGPLLDLKIHEPFQARVIHFSIFKRRHNSDIRPFKHRISPLNVHRTGPFKRDRRGRTSLIFSMQFKTDFERIAAGDDTAHGSFHDPAQSRGNRAGGHAGPAGEGFPLHAALVGAYPKRMATQLLDKINVASLWGRKPYESGARGRGRPRRLYRHPAQRGPHAARPC